MPTQRRSRSLDDAPVRQRIGPAIKSLRLEHGLSLNTLAEEAGISPSHLSRMERGLTVPSYDVLDRVADALGSDLRALREEEELAKAVDSELNALLLRIGMPESTQVEFLRLSSRTRSELVAALRSTMS